MKVYTPNRSRTALDVNSIQDPDLRNTLQKLAGLQEETRNLSNGLTPKVQMIEQEINNILNQIKQTDQKLSEVLNSVKTQISTLTDAAVRYVQMGEAALGDEPKFKKSFMFMLEAAVNNLDQVLSALKDNTGGLLTDAPVAPMGNATVDGFTAPTQAVGDVVSPPVAPEPSSLVTSSVRSRIAVGLKEFLESIKKVAPVIEQSAAKIVKNDETINEINEVMSAVSEAAAPEPEATELFSPEEAAKEPAAPADEFAPPPEEVGEATEIEESGGLEEEAPVEEEAAEEEATSDESPEEAEETDAPLEDEEAPIEEAEAETSETEDSAEAEEEVIEDEPTE